MPGPGRGPALSKVRGRGLPREGAGMAWGIGCLTGFCIMASHNSDGRMETASASSFGDGVVEEWRNEVVVLGVALFGTAEAEPADGAQSAPSAGNGRRA